MQKRSTHKWSRVEIEKAVENVVILNAILGFCRFRKTFRERMQKLCFETVCGSSTRARTSHVPLEWHVKRFTKCNLTSMGERQRSSVMSMPDTDALRAIHGSTKLTQNHGTRTTLRASFNSGSPWVERCQPYHLSDADMFSCVGAVTASKCTHANHQNAHTPPCYGK